MANQMDPAIVRDIRSIQGNDMCVDCLSPNPQWASVSFGTLFCLECSGQHRGLGVHISFVRSITMDSWSEQQIAMMRKGGNAKLREWFSERGVPNNMRISAKYHTPDAEYYAKRLKAIVEGKEIPAMPPRQPVDTSIDYSRGDPNGKEKLKGESDDDYISRQKRLNAEAKARMQAKFGGGGRMGGVGSDPNYDPNAASGGGVDVGSLVSGIGSLWGSVAAKTKEVVAVAHEDLKSREIGKKVQGGWQNTVEATKGAWQNNVNEETRAKIAGTAKGLWGTITSAVAGEDDEWDDWGDEKKRFPRSSSNNQTGGSGGGGVSVDECPGLPGEDRNGPGQLTGETEVQYIARQTRIREEAKERMRLKFGGGGGGLGGVGADTAYSSSNSSSSSISPPPAPGLSMSNKYEDNRSSFNEMKPPSPLSTSTSTPSLGSMSNSNATSGSLGNLTSNNNMSRSLSSNNTPQPKSPSDDVDFFSDFGM